VNASSKTALKEELRLLREFGTKMNILFVNVEGSSKHFLVGLNAGQFSLDYAHEGWFHLLYKHRFISFCKSRNFSIQSERWGKERVTRAGIGTAEETAVEIIQTCFKEVFGLSGQYKLKLLQIGWQSSVTPVQTQK